MAGSRVVTVSSSASKLGKIEFDNLQGERVYKPMVQAYAQSKLADLIFSLELQRRLKAVGSLAAITGRMELQSSQVIRLPCLFQKERWTDSVAKRLWVESERLTRVKFGALSDVA